MNVIVVFDSFNDLTRLHSIQFNICAQNRALLVLKHVQLVARIDDTIAAQDLTEILRFVFDATWWFAVNWQVVELIG